MIVSHIDVDSLLGGLSQRHDADALRTIIAANIPELTASFYDPIDGLMTFSDGNEKSTLTAVPFRLKSSITLNKWMLLSSFN